MKNEPFSFRDYFMCLPNRRYADLIEAEAKHICDSSSIFMATWNLNVSRRARCHQFEPSPSRRSPFLRKVDSFINAEWNVIKYFQVKCFYEQSKVVRCDMVNSSRCYAVVMTFTNFEVCNERRVSVSVTSVFPVTTKTWARVSSSSQLTRKHETLSSFV